MYQGEDFVQQLSYFTDEDQTDPIVFIHPVMDVRDQLGTLLATFDDTDDEIGLATITAPGVLVLSMDHEHTANMPKGSYPLDIFANVAGSREAITKRGLVKLVVTARITVDDGP